MDVRSPERATVGRPNCHDALEWIVSRDSTDGGSGSTAGRRLISLAKPTSTSTTVTPPPSVQIANDCSSVMRPCSVRRQKPSPEAKLVSPPPARPWPDGCTPARASEKPSVAVAAAPSRRCRTVTKSTPAGAPHVTSSNWNGSSAGVDSR